MGLGHSGKGRIATVDCKHLRTARPLLFIHLATNGHGTAQVIRCRAMGKTSLFSTMMIETRSDREEFHKIFSSLW